MGKGRTTDIADGNVGGFVRFGAWRLGPFAQFLGGKPAEALLSAGIRVQGFDSGVYLLHTPGEDFPRREIDAHDPVVTIFPVQPAALLRLVAVLEPVEPHATGERRQGLDICGESIGPVLLRGYRLCRALRVRQAAIHRLEAELGDHRRLPGDLRDLL